MDVLMAPIDAEHHILSPLELAEMRRALHPRILVPMHYRLPDLEPEEEEPEKLGPIDLWLKAETDVRRLEGHTAILSARDLPEAEQVLVFRHSPEVVPPRSAR